MSAVLKAVDNWSTIASPLRRTQRGARRALYVSPIADSLAFLEKTRGKLVFGASSAGQIHLVPTPPWL